MQHVELVAQIFAVEFRYRLAYLSGGKRYLCRFATSDESSGARDETARTCAYVAARVCLHPRCPGVVVITAARNARAV
jgi:hypothetical protein